VRDFAPANARFGSNPEVAFWALMSAFANSGNAAASALDLFAIGGDRHASRAVADGYRRADHRVGRRVDHRDVGARRVRNIGVLGARRRRGEQANQG